MKSNDRKIHKFIEVGYGWTAEIYASVNDFTGEVNFEDVILSNPKFHNKENESN